MKKVKPRIRDDSDVMLLLAMMVVLILPCPTPGHSADITGLKNFNWVFASTNRTHLDLSGEWSFKKNSDEKWQSIFLPSFLGKVGLFQFKRTIFIDSTLADKRLRFWTLGIEQRCTLFMNGKFVGTVEGGTPSFELEIPREVLYFNQKNELLLEVETGLNPKEGIPLRIRPQGIPPVHGGVFRDFFLVASPCPGIKNVIPRYSLSEKLTSCDLTLDILLQAPERSSHASADSALFDTSFTCLAELWKPGGKRPVVKTGETKIYFSKELDVIEKLNLKFDDVSLWSPENPTLYEGHVKLSNDGQIVDEYRFPIGFRKIDIFDKRFKLNDQEIKIKAIGWVDDLLYRRIHGDSLINQIESDMRAIKDLGANCVRVLSGRPHPALLSYCNKIGLFVLEETSVRGVPGAILNKPEFRAKAAEILKNQILEDINHPCVLGWGIGSNFDPKDDRSKNFVERLSHTAKEFDTRPVYAGVKAQHNFETDLPVDFQILELSADWVNLRASRVSGVESLGKRVTQLYLLSFVVPLSDRNGHTHKSRHSEEKQAFKLKASIEDALKEDKWGGVVIGYLRDWAGDSPHMAFGPRHGANWYLAGLVNKKGDKRISYEMVKAIYNQLTKPKVARIPETEDNPAIYPLVGVIVLLILLFNIRRDRSFRMTLSRIFIHPHGFYLDRRENRLISVYHSMLVGGTAFLSLALLFSSALYYLRIHPFLDLMMNVIFLDSKSAYRFLWVVWHPLWSIFVSFVFFTVGFFAIAVFIKIISLFTHKGLRFLQIVMSVNWMFASLLLTLPLAVIFYRSLNKQHIGIVVVIAVTLLIFWSALRVMRGARVLLLLNPLKIWILFGVVCGLSIFIIAAYLEQTRAVFEYMQYILMLLL